jgi:hypothetical protein
MPNLDAEISRTELNEDDGLLALPFVKKNPDWKQQGYRSPRCFWSVETSGDVQADCELGNAYARAALDYMISEDVGTLGAPVRKPASGAAIPNPLDCFTLAGRKLVRRSTYLMIPA